MAGNSDSVEDAPERSGSPAGGLPSRIVGVLDHVGAHVGAAGIVLIMLGTTADVLRRSLEGRSVPGVIEGAEVILVIAVFLGLGLAQRDDIHVSTSLVVDRVPRRIGLILRVFGLLVLAAFLVWAVWASGRAALQSFTTNEFRFGMIRVPLWPGRTAIAIGWFLLLLEVVLDIHRILITRTPQPGAGDPRTVDAGPGVP